MPELVQKAAAEADVCTYSLSYFHGFRGKAESIGSAFCFSAMGGYNLHNLPASAFNNFENEGRPRLW